MGSIIFNVCAPFPLLTGRMKSYPNVQFLIIINPDDGPGNDTLLDPNYQRELGKLNAMSNVRTIGYVPTGWTTRNITRVMDEVSTYASWANNSVSFELDGIFFDETPNNYTEAGVTYMANIDNFVKTLDGFRGANYVCQRLIDSR